MENHNTGMASSEQLLKPAPPSEHDVGRSSDASVIGNAFGPLLGSVSPDAFCGRFEAGLHAT